MGDNPVVTRIAFASFLDDDHDYHAFVVCLLICCPWNLLLRKQGI